MLVSHRIRHHKATRSLLKLILSKLQLQSQYSRRDQLPMNATSFCEDCWMFRYGFVRSSSFRNIAIQDERPKSSTATLPSNPSLIKAKKCQSLCGQEMCSGDLVQFGAGGVARWVRREQVGRRSRPAVIDANFLFKIHIHHRASERARSWNVSTFPWANQLNCKVVASSVCLGATNCSVVSFPRHRITSWLAKMIKRSAFDVW